MIGAELIGIAKSKQTDYGEFTPYGELVALNIETGSVARRVSLEGTGVSCNQSPFSFTIDTEWIVLSSRGDAPLVVFSTKTFEILHRLSPLPGVLVDEAVHVRSIVLTNDAIIATCVGKDGTSTNDEKGIYVIRWDRETCDVTSHILLGGVEDFDHHETALVGGKLGILLNVANDATIGLEKGHYLRIFDLPALNQISTHELLSTKGSSEDCCSFFFGSGGSVIITLGENGAPMLRSVDDDGNSHHHSFDMFGYQNRSGVITRVALGRNLLVLNVQDEGDQNLRFGSNELDLYNISPDADKAISCTRLWSSFSETPLAITANQWSVVAGCGGKQKTLGEFLDENSGGVHIDVIYAERDFGSWKDIRKLRVWDFTAGAIPVLRDTFVGDTAAADSTDASFIYDPTAPAFGKGFMTKPANTEGQTFVFGSTSSM
jgi:hypothetical protein